MEGMTMSPPRSNKNKFALAAICLASLMFGLEISSVPVALPALERLLHADFQDLQWIMNAYTLACTAVLMATGALADRYGRKRLFVGSTAAFGLASLLCGLADGAAVLVAARALQGVAGGAMLICALAILSQQFRDGRERGRAFAAWGMVFGVGLGFGPIIGGAIVALCGWQWVFLVHLPLAVLTLALLFAGVEESRDPHAARLDMAGIATLSLAVLGLTYGITRGAAPAGGGLGAGAIALASAASLAAFVVVERRRAHPMMDFSVFRIRPFSGALLGSMGMNFSYWPFMIYLPIYFQSVLGYGSVAAGLSLLAYTLPTLLLPPLGERLARRYSAGVVIPAGLFTIGLGFLLMRHGAGLASASWLSMLPGALLAGAGLGITNTPVSNTTTGSVPGDRAGMASGIDMSARMISLAVNIALMGLILLAGITAHVQRSLPGALDAATLRALAERIAAGDLAAGGAGQVAGVARGALAQGFEWVMLYGGLGAWLLAGLSWLTFAPRARPRGAVAAPPRR
jgi:EmrB/QacA subfamily drug resistance transporter